MRVMHIITRLILGGAQENTLLNCHDLLRDFDDDVLLVAGPALGPEGSLEEEARRRGIPLQTVPSLRRAINPLHDLPAYRALRRAIREFQPEVVHTHSGKAGLLGRMAAHKERVPAILHTVHGAPFHRYQSPVARALFRNCERYAARRCHRLISVADAMTEQLVTASVAPLEKFVTIYSGMEIEPLLAAQKYREQTRQRFGFGPEEIVVGKVARLFHLKGHEDLLPAFREAQRQLPALRLLLVGDGILRESLERKVEELGVGQVVRFSGLLPRGEIPAVMASIDLLVHTSYREGLARTLPQALLAGKPVISFDVDGAREVVRDGETGRLLPPGDRAALATAMVQLGESDALRNRLANAGRELCKSRFDHRLMTASIRQVAVEILNQRASTTAGFS